MKEDNCSYELSKALKAAGFNEPCEYYYKLSKWVRRGRFPAKKRYPQRYKGYLDLIKEEPKIELINDDGITNKRLTDNETRITNWADECVMPHYEYATAPTLWRAQKWLRERIGIAVNVIAHDGGKHEYDIVFLPNAVETDRVPDRSPWCKSYEEALSEGIESALELINPK